MGLSTLHFCYNDGRDTCRRIPPGSEVFIKCAPGYINSAKPYHSQTIFCNLDGTFEEERLQCVMNCGQSPMPNTALILNGFTTLQMQVPWQVAIYQKADGKNYKYICAGSIVSPSVIITGESPCNYYSRCSTELILFTLLYCSCPLFLGCGQSIGQ